ncbi:MAG TPA: biopolymer transporter ExbD [Polyangiaceae bacterium]
MSAAQRGKLRRASTPVSGENENAELNVVPFLDIIVNVMMFVLATVAITFTSTADIKPPSNKPSHAAPTNLAIVVTGDVMSVKTSAGTVANVPRGDYAELKRVVAMLKESPDDKSVTITASANVRYESLVATMDAVRQTDDGKDLFPDVAFGVVR